MSGNLSRKRKRKSMRLLNKEEIRWYTKLFAEEIDTESFPQSGYTILTSQQVRRLVQSGGLRNK